MIRSAMIQIVCMMLALAALAGCGKRGNPVPPGPADQITYPKTYPSS